MEWITFEVVPSESHALLHIAEDQLSLERGSGEGLAVTSEGWLLEDKPVDKAECCWTSVTLSCIPPFENFVDYIR